MELQEASSLKQVEKCELPMLFIHGDKDTYVPTWMVYPLYEAKPEPKELWIVPEQPMPSRTKRINRNTPTKYGISSGGIFIKPIITRSFGIITEKVSIFANVK